MLGILVTLQYLLSFLVPVASLTSPADISLTPSPLSRVLISQNGWQRWMVGLMIHWTDCGSEGQHVSDIAYSLFQTLLHHALQWEQDGWLVWVETLSILHAYQSDGQGKLTLDSFMKEY